MLIQAYILIKAALSLTLSRWEKDMEDFRATEMSSFQIVNEFFVLHSNDYVYFYL